MYTSIQKMFSNLFCLVHKWFRVNVKKFTLKQHLVLSSEVDGTNQDKHQQIYFQMSQAEF